MRAKLKAMYGRFVLWLIRPALEIDRVSINAVGASDDVSRIIERQIQSGLFHRYSRNPERGRSPLPGSNQSTSQEERE